MKEKKTLSLRWLLHLASPHNSKCRIYNFFLFHIYMVGFETNSNKMDNENQSKNQKKKKKKNRKQEEIPKFNRAFYFFYLCLPSSSERLFRFLMKHILVTPLAN